MGVRTLLLFLIGQRRAILDIASTGQALWVGMLFVLCAGFAREYDGEDLLHEPWHLLIPLAASLLSSFTLFAIGFVKVLLNDASRPPFFAAYRSFLSLFWMTAPLAWLYAIPYERFLTPAAAVEANLWTLGLVALWRVVLMVRVISVLMGYRLVAAFFLVMAFADAVALLAIGLTPKPMVSIMGGVRLTESERLIHNVTCCIGLLGILTVPVWGGGALLAFASSKPAWQAPPLARKQSSSSGRGLWMLAVASLAVWVFVLPWTQAEQLRRYQVERDLRSGRIAEALATMTAHAPTDFPPHWDPPPRVGYGEARPHLLDVVEVIADQPPAPGVQARYVAKLRLYLGDEDRFSTIERVELSRIAMLLRRLPEGPSVAADHRQSIKYMLDRPKEFSQELRDSLKAILATDGGKKSSPSPD